jgi:hypothetical protein
LSRSVLWDYRPGVVIFAQVVSMLAAAAISFGRTGGNIIPYHVSISGTGAVTTRGPVQSTKHVSIVAVRGLFTLAGAERFSSLPRRISCKGTSPDIASTFITINGTTVTSHGLCNRRFAELYAVLKAVTEVG